MLVAGDQEQLVAAAYVHDVGYAPTVKSSGLHALDAARHLRSLGYERLARLVAHHSCARFEAQTRGLRRALRRCRADEQIRQARLPVFAADAAQTRPTSRKASGG
jgi:HD superfamily phosphodiesterase